MQSRHLRWYLCVSLQPDKHTLKKLIVSGSLSEADCDLAVHGDDGGDTDMLSSSNKSTCDSLCETEEGIYMYRLYTEYLLFTRLGSI